MLSAVHCRTTPMHHTGKMPMKKLSVLLAAAFYGLAALPAENNGTNSLCTKDRSGIGLRKVALVVQNHAAPGVDIPFMALTDALAVKLSECGLQVINPYNSVGVNQNRTASGEKTPSVSAIELAKQLKADGAVTASILELLDLTEGTPPRLHVFSIRVAISLADAQTGAVVGGEMATDESPRKYTNNEVARKKQKYLGDLIFSAAVKCAEKLKNNENVKNWKPTPPPTPKPPHPPKRPLFDKIVDKLSAEMLSSPKFVENYGEQKDRGGRIPIAVIGGMENASGRAEFDAGLKLAGERFRKKLFDSKLFDVKDDAVLVSLAKRIVDGENSPLEDGGLMEELKQHGSPDFFIVGNLTHFADLDGAGYYKFRITMHSLRTGKIVWEDMENITTAAKGAK